MFLNPLVGGGANLRMWLTLKYVFKPTGGRVGFDKENTKPYTELNL
jgi:hypothetical protein